MNEHFEGIVLFKRLHRENDGLVKIFTREYGTKMFFIRHLEKPNHSLRSHLLPMTRHAYVGRINQTGLSFLSEASTLDFYPSLQQDFVKQAYGTYIMQLMDASIDDNVPDPSRYQFLVDLLDRIAKEDNAPIYTLFAELKLLPSFGTYLNLQSCVICGERQGPFDFSVREQGVLCQRHFDRDDYRLRLHPNTVFLLQQFDRLMLSQLGNIHVSEDYLQELRNFMDIIYQEFVGIRLRSKSYLDQLDSIQEQMSQLKTSRDKNLSPKNHKSDLH